jgi:hypothetical protein
VDEGVPTVRFADSLEMIGKNARVPTIAFSQAAQSLVLSGKRVNPCS